MTNPHNQPESVFLPLPLLPLYSPADVMDDLRSMYEVQLENEQLFVTNAGVTPKTSTTDLLTVFDKLTTVNEDKIEDLSSILINIFAYWVDKNKLVANPPKGYVLPNTDIRPIRASQFDGRYVNLPNDQVVITPTQVSHINNGYSTLQEAEDAQPYETAHLIRGIHQGEWVPNDPTNFEVLTYHLSVIVPDTNVYYLLEVLSERIDEQLAEYEGRLEQAPLYPYLDLFGNPDDDYPITDEQELELGKMLNAGVASWLDKNNIDLGVYYMTPLNM